MIRLYIALALLFLGGSAMAQSTVRPTAIIVPSCGTPPSSLYTAGSEQKIVQDVNGNLCTGVTANAVTTATASASPTAVSAGTGKPLNIDLNSELFVNCTTGCSGGTSSNATSGVATSSTNGTTNGWLYGFNGTTWDQLQVDGSKFLKVVLPSGFATSANQATEITSLATIATNTGAAIPAGSALIGKVGIDQTTPGTTNGVAVVGVNGATALAGNGGTGTGSQRVTIANDSSARAVGGEGATGAAAPSGAVYAGVLGSGATGGLMAGAIVCDKYVFKHITTATDTLAVQGVASQQIRICGIKAWAAGTATFFLENTASANANCSSTLAQIDILHTMIAQSGIVDHTPFWTGLSNTSGNGLCINSTGTGGVDVGIYYAQF